VTCLSEHFDVYRIGAEESETKHIAPLFLPEFEQRRGGLFVTCPYGLYSIRALVEDEELFHTRAPGFLNPTVTDMGTVSDLPSSHPFILSYIDHRWLSFYFGTHAGAYHSLLGDTTHPWRNPVIPPYLRLNYNSSIIEYRFVAEYAVSLFSTARYTYYVDKQYKTRIPMTSGQLEYSESIPSGLRTISRVPSRTPTFS
jgi:hypothetical protein